MALGGRKLRAGYFVGFEERVVQVREGRGVAMDETVGVWEVSEGEVVRMVEGWEGLMWVIILKARVRKGNPLDDVVLPPGV